MSTFDPDTVALLRSVLDDAWALLPKTQQSEIVKSEMAQRLLKQAADGVRDPVKLQASALGTPIV